MLSLLVALCSSASPVLLQDIAPGAAVDSETYLEVDTGADPNVLVIQNDFWGAELFTILDGRRSLVIDLCPGPCSANPTQLTRLGPRLFFLASDQGYEFPNQLWITDGTAAGTLKLSDAVSRILLLGEQLIFQKGADLWVSDGTREGTTALPWGTNRALVAAQATAEHRFLQVNPAACELFATGLDVRQAIALPMPSAGACREPLATLGERAFLSLSSGLWRLEATPTPATQLDPAPGAALTKVGAGLFFFRSAPASLSLFHTTGEPGGTIPLGAVVSDALKDSAALGNRLLYSAPDPAGVGHLYSSDGTPAGTFELPMSATSTHAILPVGPVAYVVTAIAGPVGTELLETDGTASGTVVLQGVHPLHAPQPTGHREAKGHALALALIANVLNEFGAFRIRPGEDPESIFLKPANPRGIAPFEPVVSGALAFFTAGTWAFRTDGTAEGTAAFSDGGFVAAVGGRLLVSEGSALSAVVLDGGAATSLGAGPFPNPLGLGLGDTALFFTRDATRTLFRTDGTEAGTAVLTDLGPGLATLPLRLADGRGVITGKDRVVFSGGTAQTTRTVAVPGLIQWPVPAGAAVWFVTGPASVSRVTEDAAQSVAIPSPGVPGNFPYALTTLGDDAYFLTADPSGSHLWRVTGSTPTRLHTLRSARALAAYRGRLMVLGDRGEGEQLLELVNDALVTRCPAPGATFLQVAGELLFVDAAAPTTGLELHHFEELPQSVLIPVADLAPGPGSSNPSPPTAFGKKFLFTAWTPETGREPFSWEPEPPPPPPKQGCGCDSGATGGLALLLCALLCALLACRRSRLRRFVPLIGVHPDR